MARASIARRRELLDLWRGIQEEEEDAEGGDPSSPKHRSFIRAKEDWFSDCFKFLVGLPNEEHIWCGYADMMGPLLETFHGYFMVKEENSPLRTIWKRISKELDVCTQCVCQHHQAQEFYDVEYQSDTVDPLLKVLRFLDEERVTEHLKQINARIQLKEYSPSCHSAAVVSVMFEVLMYPVLLDDQLLADQFQIFIEAIDESYEVSLSINQQYPGVYALLFFKSGRARAIGLRLARSMGKLRRAADLEPLQPLLTKYINFLEADVLPSSLESSRPRVQLRRADVWLGFKSLLGFLEAPAFEDGILERYPIFLNIVLNHVSDDTSDLSCAVSCLKASFEMLGCKLWLRTTLSPSVMRNTLLGHCFHTRDEKSHKEVFDLFLPFLQSLEALQDGEHEKQRRNILFFLLHQVTRSSNFSVLMRKNACKIALLIVQRGYIMSPPCPPSECAHMWGPTLISSLKDTSLHSSLRQPAFDLMNILVISDASALISFKLKYQSVAKIDVSNFVVFVDDEDELPFSHDAEEKDYSCWNDFCVLSKMTSRECKDWSCVPLLWYLTMVQLDPSMLPIAFSKAVFWALSHVSVLEPGFAVESSVPVDDWLSSNAREISSSFSWQIPNGSDDGGDGKESRNTLNVSTFCTLLLRIFKRFATNFIMQIEHRELQKQWIWEPMMAESLILSLIDHNDNLRQFGRAILEHVSQARGLTSGLQFLCSSASSLSAVFLGLRYAVRLVEAKSVLGDFHSLHHLFFVMCKLLREVVAQKPPVAQPAKPSEGGFLRQTFLNFSISSPEHAATVVDVVSWEKFSTLLSATLWPFVLMCLEKGEELMNNKQCQIACVRLLELFPLVYERVNSYSCIQSCNMIPTVPNLSDLTWLSHLINWGRSSLLVIIRHWKQCMLSLFERLGSHSGTFQQNIDALGDLISHDTVDIDELKERVLNLKLIWSKEAFAETERGAIVKVPMVARPISSIPSLIGRTFHERHTSGDNVVDVETTKPSHAATSEKVIVLSDSEEESLTTVDLDTPEVLSSVVTEKYKPTNADISREQAKSSQPGKVIEDSQASLKQQICTPVGDIGASSRPVSADSGSTTAPSKVAGQRKKLSASSNADTTSVRLRKAKSSATATCQPLRPNLSSNSEKFKSIFREISDDEDDPLEHALDNCRRSKPLLTKPSILVPKRQVVQLPLPAGNKQGFVSRTDVGLRRLRPPKLDSWYKDILGMDYFAIAGLSSPEITKKPALKEVPVHFDSEVQYVEIFRPLVLEEFKAQLQNACIETSPDDMICGSISILSVERVDDFLIIRGRPEDSEFVASRGCTENDLILLTKEPLKNSGQQVHVLGKVERREKTDKNKAFIFVIRFFLSKENARLNKVKRLLVERSKWFLNRVMSMTPQLREFSALSSLNDIPVLPIILNPIGCPASYHVSGKVRLDKLPQPMQKVLKSSYNDSQLQAVSVAIGSINSKRNFELSLIQGPPGTGKTRTIVAIVSALLSLYADNFCKSLRNECLSSAGCTNARTKMSQSAAIARAWQDAAFAKQMIKDSQIGSPKMTERLSKGRALICAQSNAAVDELVSRLSEGLYGADGKVYRPYIVRVGNAKTVHPNSLPCFIDTLVEQRLADELKTNTDAKSCCNAESSITLRARFEKVVDRIRHLESRRKLIEGPVPNEDETDEVSDEAIGAKLNILYAQKRAVGAELAAAHAREKKIADEKMSLKHKVRKSILGEAEIVVTTLSGCGGDIYGVCSESASANKFGNFSEHTLFDVVVIDEAAQALEPATLIPLQLLKSKGTKCIMVGDPKQLPATVMSGLASKFLYECSMFERLQRAGHPVIMLTEQYRMHPEISRFPSLHFYENKLLDGAQMSEKSAPFHDHQCLGPYKFFDVRDGREHCGKNGATQSLCNASEADVAIEILKFLRMRYPSEFSCKKIGIITPYRSQLSLLRSKFTSLFGPEIVSEMELNTVDGFQGREVDILVLSTVRASDSSDDRQHAGDRRSIGFVADVRRVNVALTRAKFSLWIVGNARTLQTNAHWASLIQNAKERNLFLSVERPYGLILGKVRSHSKDVLSVTCNNYIASLKQKEDDKIAAPSMILQRSDADVQKEQLVHTGRTVGKEASIHLLNHPSIGPKASQDLTKCSNQAKRASRWDQKDPKGQGSMVRRYSGDKKAVKQNNNVRMSKAFLERDDHQDSMVRNHSEEKVPIKRDNNLEPTNRSVKSDSHQDSSVSSKSEVKRPVKQNDDVKTVKGLLKQDAVLESVPEKNDACPPKYPDMKKLIKKAKGARKFSERPTSGNSVDPSLSFQAADASCHMSELNKSKATNLAGQNHLIAARKRQREDVEFLLSSALISSKKPSSKLPSKKQK